MMALNELRVIVRNRARRNKSTQELFDLAGYKLNLYPSTVFTALFASHVVYLMEIHDNREAEIYPQHLSLLFLFPCAMSVQNNIYISQINSLNVADASFVLQLTGEKGEIRWLLS